jgi:stage II sporulation protein D
MTVKKGEIILISRFQEKIAIKPVGSPGFLTDSIIISCSEPGAYFSIRTGQGAPDYRDYSGTLEFRPDFGSLLAINKLDIEDYIAGVVKAEGGSGKKSEYFKSQAVIARTYTYKYFNKHITDRYNLCDDTHCQAFAGITGDSLITSAVRLTSGQVLATSDSSLIISAFHSNCGGETSPSELAWLAPHPYLVKVTDPYCVTSRNATWQKTISLHAWTEMLTRNGYIADSAANSESFVFRQRVRMMNYTTGSFSMPFSKIRSELGLRSAWFSVSAAGNSLVLSGRGYGHGVGLCQEGAMVMAAGGEKYEEILLYYYPGVRIIGIDKAKNNQDEKKSSN